MNYIGEHLFPGQLGQFLVILSLIASLIATIAYAKSTNSTLETEAASWKKLARVAFVIDALAIFSVFGIIYFLIARHYFEYYYVWDHSDTSLSPKYLLSSIWEGQQGSFLLWAFWQSVLGLVLMKTTKKWEGPVLTVMSFAQFCLSTMVLGIYFFDVKVGNTPFTLLRHSGVLDNAPMLFDQSGALRHDYLQAITQRGGKGLNQLLQNYWMVIHPPVLFLGFASTIVPFAFAISGLWKKDYKGWTKMAVPWALFSAGVLGLGIMMGAKWAYESLNFGGYWAWDPVENASLVPWLIMVGGLHTLLVYNTTGHSLRATYLFFILSFVLVLYSTYLTRSGDLQDTSVHAFTDLGMNWQLRSFVAIFLVPAGILFARRYKQIPHIAKEEGTYSREFWMFIGSLILFLASLYIIAATSLPVINKVFGTNFSVGEEKLFAYNRILIFVAIILGLLTAVTQYLKYRKTDKAYFGRKIAIPTVVSLLLSLGISIIGKVHYDKYGMGFLAAIHLAIFASVYTMVANIGYIWAGMRGSFKAAGASVAHVGFGMMLLGILISSSKEQVLSVNKFDPLNFGTENKEKGSENMTLYQGIKTDMGRYWVTYVSDSTEEKGKKVHYRIDMETKNGKDRFSLYPDLVKGNQGISNNPDAKHYWNRDIFSYINYSSTMANEEDTASFHPHILALKDSVKFTNGVIVLDSVIVNPQTEKHHFTAGDTALMAHLTIYTYDNRRFTAEPVYYIHDNRPNYVVDTVFSQGLAIGLTRVMGDRRLEVRVKESPNLVPLVALKVLKFPFINLLWLGTIIMLIGFVMSVVRRIQLL